MRSSFNIAIICVLAVLGTSMRLGSLLSSSISGGFKEYKEAVLTKTHKLVLPDTHLPHEHSDVKRSALHVLRDRFSFIFTLTGWSTWELLKFEAKCRGLLNKIKDTSKLDTAIFEKSQKKFVDNFVKSIPGKPLPSNYNFFSNGDAKTNLELIVKSNPFLASALSSSDSLIPLFGKTTLELNSYGGKKTWFSRLIDTMDKKYPRINIVFNDNLEIASFKVYDLSGKHVKEIGMSVQDAAAYTSMLLSFYGEAVHALIHVFNMIMISAIRHSSEDTTSIKDFSAAFEPNIGIKYQEVALLLFKEKTGILTGGHFAVDGTKVITIVREMLCDWGSRKSADDFLNGFLFAGLSKSGKKLAESAGVLGEYRRHLALAAPFAADVSSHFASDHTQNFKNFESNLTNYLSKCGTGVSKVNSLKQWIELMSALGLMHGGTLSMTRNMIAPEVISKVTFGNTYTKADVTTIQAALGTIVGIIDGHHVYGSAISKTKDKKLEEILKRYDTLSSLQKELYFNSIKTDPLFSKFGWIWTDYAPDLVDGKQLTITTYI